MNTKEIDGVKYIPYDEHMKTVIMAIQLEREACANICDHNFDYAFTKEMAVAYGNCAEEIRNRSA